MILLSFSTGSAFWDFVLQRPFLSAITYVVLNVLIYGFRGIFGGFLPEKVTLSACSFYTSRRNAFHSEKLTRIVQWRYFDGKNLPKEVRDAILQKYGPSKERKCMTLRHYKEVEPAKTQQQ